MASYVCCRCGESFRRPPSSRVWSRAFCGNACRHAQNIEDRKLEEAEERRTARNRFWKSVRIGGIDECWPWNGLLGSYGYGIVPRSMRKGERSRGSNRIAWLHHAGFLIPSLLVLHGCGNRSCCNPSHLYPGNYARNVKDMMEDGTHLSPRGSASAKAILNESQVRKIRDLYATGATIQRKLGTDFGVSRTTIENIVNRYTWRHI